MNTPAKHSWKGLAFVSPWLAGFVLFTLLPAGLSFYYSFCDYSLLQPPLFVGLDNYRTLAHDPVFWLTIRHTAIYAVLALPLGLAIALALALLLNQPVRGQGVYRTLVYLPSLVPAVASGMLWLWLLNSKLGLVNLGLRGLGVRNPPGWLSDARLALLSLVIVSFWSVGNTVIIFLAGLQDVPRELYEAAEIDGAGAAQSLRHVTLPVLSPVIFFNLIMGLIACLQIFTLPYIMTQGGPARSTYFYTHYMYDNAFAYLKMGYCSAMAWLQLLAVLALTGLAFWSSRRWVHYQGR